MTKPKSDLIIRSYEGSKRGAIKAFEKDSKKMALQGCFPIEQQWVPGKYGCFLVILSIVLIPSGIGFFMLLWMLIFDAKGSLTVLYQLQE